MKKYLAPILCLAASLVMPVAASASEHTATEVKSVKVTASATAASTVTPTGEKTLTLDAATQLALKSNSSLNQWASRLDIAQDTLSNAVKALNGVSLSSAVPSWEQDSADLQAASTVNSYKIQVKMLQYQEPLLKDQVAFTVLQSYITWTQLDKGIALAQQRVALLQKQLEASALQLKLGLISQATHTEAANALQVAQTSLANAQASQQELLRSLKSLIGVDYDFVPDYVPVYEKVTLGDKDTYVAQSVNTSNTLKIQELSVDSAQYDLDFIYDRGELTMKTLKTNLENAQRTYKDAKTSYENNLQSLCTQLPLQEQNLANEKAALDKANTDLANGKLSLDLGLISQNDYDALALAVAAAENDVLTATCQLVVSAYQYAHPDMASSGSSGSSESSES